MLYMKNAGWAQRERSWLFVCICAYVCYSNLPAKPAEEAQKHRQQYEEMVAQAKKRGELIRQRFNALCLSRMEGITGTWELQTSYQTKYEEPNLKKSAS